MRPATVTLGGVGDRAAAVERVLAAHTEELEDAVRWTEATAAEAGWTDHASWSGTEDRAMHVARSAPC